MKCFLICLWYVKYLDAHVIREIHWVSPEMVAAPVTFDDYIEEGDQHVLSVFWPFYKKRESHIDLVSLYSITQWRNLNNLLDFLSREWMWSPLFLLYMPYLVHIFHIFLGTNYYNLILRSLYYRFFFYFLHFSCLGAQHFLYYFVWLRL